ncbi:MAG: hypothetical protein CM15mV90_240 [uncultured marine virus]|nr:MAG: hypothetical protein CM15mV90_240 [uncultured marine virus]
MQGYNGSDCWWYFRPKYSYSSQNYYCFSSVGNVTQVVFTHIIGSPSFWPTNQGAQSVQYFGYDYCQTACNLFIVVVNTVDGNKQVGPTDPPVQRDMLAQMVLYCYCKPIWTESKDNCVAYR